MSEKLCAKDVYNTPVMFRPQVLGAFLVENERRLWAFLHRRHTPPHLLEDQMGNLHLFLVELFNQSAPNQSEDEDQWWPWMFAKANTRLRTLEQSGAYTGVSGASGARRRNQFLNRLRIHMDAEGTSVSDAELVENANRICAGTRVDASKQGMRFDISDLTSTTPVGFGERQLGTDELEQEAGLRLSLEGILAGARKVNPWAFHVIEAAVDPTALDVDLPSACQRLSLPTKARDGAAALLAHLAKNAGLGAGR
mgnify:CR=1 FL=1